MASSGRDWPIARHRSDRIGCLWKPAEIFIIIMNRFVERPLTMLIQAAQEKPLGVYNKLSLIISSRVHTESMPHEKADKERMTLLITVHAYVDNGIPVRCTRNGEAFLCAKFQGVRKLCQLAFRSGPSIFPCRELRNNPIAFAV